MLKLQADIVGNDPRRKQEETTPNAGRQTSEAKLVLGAGGAEVRAGGAGCRFWTLAAGFSFELYYTNLQTVLDNNNRLVSS